MSTTPIPPVPPFGPDPDVPKPDPDNPDVPKPDPDNPDVPKPDPDEVPDEQLPHWDRG